MHLSDPWKKIRFMPEENHNIQNTIWNTVCRSLFQKYNINIRDEKQPLLITKPKEKSIRGGDDKPVWLIPELCRITGMTERQRSDIG